MLQVLNTTSLLKQYYVIDTMSRRRLLKVYREPHNLENVLLVPVILDKHFHLTAQHPCSCRNACLFSFILRHANKGREIFPVVYTLCEKGKTIPEIDFGEQSHSVSSCLPHPIPLLLLQLLAGSRFVCRCSPSNAGDASGHLLFNFAVWALLELVTEVINQLCYQCHQEFPASCNNLS